jgi:hypothetical protein
VGAVHLTLLNRKARFRHYPPGVTQYGLVPSRVARATKLPHQTSSVTTTSSISPFTRQTSSSTPLLPSHIATSSLCSLLRSSQTTDEAPCRFSLGRARSTIHFYLRLRDNHGLDSFSPQSTAQRLHSPRSRKWPIIKVRIVISIIKIQGVCYKKKAIVRGNARPSPSRPPSLNISFPASSRLQERRMNGLSLKRNPKRCT